MLEKSINDFQLYDLLNTKNLDLIKQKLNNFKQLSTIDQSSNRNDSTTHYSDWLDLPMGKKLNIDCFDQYTAEQLDDLLDQLYTLFPNSLGKELPLEISERYGLSMQRLQIFNRENPDLHYSIHSKFSDDIVLPTLLKEKRIFINGNYRALLDDKLFLKHKDLYREFVVGWDDQEFTQSLIEVIDQSPEYEQLFKWILTHHERFNWDLFRKNYLYYVATVKHSKLYDIEVHASEEPTCFFLKNIKYAFKTTQLLDFYMTSYSSELLACEQYEIDSVEVLDHFLTKYCSNTNNPFCSKKKRMFVHTNSSNLQLIKMLTENKIQFFGQHIYDTQENIEYLSKNNPKILLDYNYRLFKDTSSSIQEKAKLWSELLKDNYKPEIFNLGNDKIKDIYTLSMALSEYTLDEKVYQPVWNRAIKEGNLDYIKHHLTRFPNVLISDITTCYELGHLELFEYLMQFRISKGYSVAGAFIKLLPLACAKLDVENVKKFFEATLSDQAVSIENISLNFLNSYYYLSMASNEQEKQSAWEIINYFKKFYIEFNCPPLKEPNHCGHELKPVYYYIIHQDYQFFKSNPIEINGKTFTYLDALLYSIHRGDLADIKNILSNLSADERKELSEKMESIIFGLLSSKSSCLKVFLYLVQEFPQCIDESSLTEISIIAVETNNHQLIDILLHRFNIRLIQPKSPQHDTEIMELNYLNLVKASKTIKDCTYQFPNIHVSSPQVLEKHQKKQSRKSILTLIK
ncbi:hypothetical protein CYY_003881 [Polysphondylium violaceum]|uniref:Uncharacterized protein n=1 Tax=Polysphondylium violaceum TaxID=133409 RepID=A0A8J4PYE5_9MYCE|nr:hypothetical protein CYY_003881 [Polysphondylium violaceum]